MRLRKELLHDRSSNTALPFFSDDTNLRRFSSECRSASLVQETSYFGYLKKRLQTASLYSLWIRILTYFRRFRLISTVIKVVSYALTIVGTGAFFLAVTASTLILVPFVFIFFSFFLLSRLLTRKKKFESLARVLSGRTVYVFFPPPGYSFKEGVYFEKNVKILSQGSSGNNFVIIVSPYFISPKGIGGKKRPYYHVLRYESENVCIVRRSSFFALRRNLLSHISTSIIYVY